jgi:hypothetical protein
MTVINGIVHEAMATASAGPVMSIRSLRACQELGPPARILTETSRGSRTVRRQANRDLGNGEIMDNNLEILRSYHSLHANRQ